MVIGPYAVSGARRRRWGGIRAYPGRLLNRDAIRCHRYTRRGGHLLLAERSERRADLLREELRLLPRREVPALVDLVEVDQVAIGPPGPRLRGSIDLVRKDRDGHRERDLGRFLRGREQHALAAGLPVQPRGRGGAVRQPVQRDVVKEIVCGEQALGLAVVVVIHPGRQPRWRVRQGLADHLRSRAHHGGVGPVLLVERVERVERRAFLLGESRRRGPAAGEHRGHLGRHRRRQVDVDAEQSRRRLARHRARDRGAPVAALGDVAGVPEARISSAQARAMRSGFQPVPVGLPEKPYPGIEGSTRSNASSARPP